MNRAGHPPLLALLLVSLAACRDVPTRPSPPPATVDSPSFRLILNQPLTIPPNSATVRLQFGQIVPRNGVQEVEPHCIFEIDSVSAAAQQVEPDEFRVTRVRRSTSTIGARPRPGAVKVEFDDSPGYTQIFYRTEFRLRSQRQPQARALTCQSDQTAPGIAIMRHLTLGEIRAALGGYFTLLGPAI